MRPRLASTLGGLRRGRGVFGTLGERFAARHAAPTSLGRGVVLLGTVWPGGDQQPRDGAVVVDGRGMIDYLGGTGAVSLPADLPVIGGQGYWIGPGISDAHVHLIFADPDVLDTGLVGVRDLGAPVAAARAWRSGHRAPPEGRPMIAVCGPIITAPGGYPTRSWGTPGIAAALSGPGEARSLVQRIAADGADVIKIALEPGVAGWPVPGPPAVRAVVEAAHDAGLAVVAHALRAAMVRRALRARVDELAHVPTEPLPEDLLDALAAAQITVVSTLQTFFAAGEGPAAASNAARLHQVGVRLVYGTDLGNDGTRPGIDPRELDRLAATGLGRLGALRAATTGSAGVAGMRRRSGMLRVGEPAALVVLPANPLAEPGAWRAPAAVIADGRLVQPDNLDAAR